ncbi:P-loop NTPase family protein [Metabacillus halosaccharovorans]|uniref:Topology modulation protein n=1 Tax=Metabacillus halosaccharovorans TaxID=930124 RepID=A0ABT3DGB8_9BACI|nr:topology modulation protein [Metabacillus halosaccharovorans]MCV9886061.1 topology modulation protein [Metabacillus halosaccharovorans]
MEKIMVIGVSAGAGKSTFARKLSDILQINVHHLDTMYWEPGWVEATFEDFKSRQQEVINQQEWIIEGNYRNTFEMRVEKADTIIYIEKPLTVCLYRVMKRWLTNIGKDRPDRAVGCNEKIDMAFIKFICSTYFQRKKKMRQQLEKLKSSKQVFIFKTNTEIDTFLRRLAN